MVNNQYCDWRFFLVCTRSGKINNDKKKMLWNEDDVNYSTKMKTNKNITVGTVQTSTRLGKNRSS